jgi:hypothetical protein
MSSFFVGTEDGLITIQAEGEAWTQEAPTVLQGKRCCVGRISGPDHRNLLWGWCPFLR